MVAFYTTIKSVLGGSRRARTLYAPLSLCSSVRIRKRRAKQSLAAVPPLSARARAISSFLRAKARDSRDHGRENFPDDGGATRLRFPLDSARAAAHYRTRHARECDRQN